MSIYQDQILQFTPEQGAVISAFTGVLACSYPVFHEYVEKLMGRPVFTHELASKEFEAELQRRARADFVALCPE